MELEEELEDTHLIRQCYAPINHCALTLALLPKLNRLSRLLVLKLPKTGSTAPNR